MPDYSSFTTTPSKVSTTYNGLQDVQQQIIDLPALQATFRSNTQISNGLLTVPIITGYEVDYVSLDTTNPNGLYFQFTFPNMIPEIASSINFIPVFYSNTLLDTTAVVDAGFIQIWEVQDSNMVVSLSGPTATIITYNEKHQQAILPSYMDLYLTFSNNGLYYNV